MPPQPPKKKIVSLFDADGKPLPEGPPKPLTATWCRRAHYRGKARVGLYDNDGISGDPIREAVVRAQVPYVVTLFVYNSRFDVAATPREYFLYAPLEPQHGVSLALGWWRVWEGPKRESEFTFGNLEDIYPQVSAGAVAEAITDKEFDDHWKDVQRRNHRAAGHPDDPFGFTCLDQDVRAFKIVDPQTGLRHKIR